MTIAGSSPNPPKPTDTSPEIPYTPSSEMEALARIPKRYLIVVDEEWANESCPVPVEYRDEEGRGHRLGRTKLHPYRYPEELPPLGFIVMPSLAPIESLLPAFEEVYEIFREQGVIKFPYNGA